MDIVITMSRSQPKARFYTRINENDYLGLTVWPGKTDPSAEVIVAQLRHRDGFPSSPPLHPWRGGRPMNRHAEYPARPCHPCRGCSS